MPLSNRVCFLVNLRDRLSCVQCGLRPLQTDNYHQGFEYHHIIPKSQGGSDAADNITLLCRVCHQKQHHKTGLSLQESITAPATFHCNHCNKELNANTVEMNCGWYTCGKCQQTIMTVCTFFRLHAVKTMR